jgi:hypothetical protein
VDAVKKLTYFRNKYSDQRCFIVGNGASLNKTPLDLLKDDVSIGMNMVSMIFDRTPWRPDFMVVTTTALGDKRYRDLIMAGIMESEYSFIWDEFKDDPEVGSADNIVFIPVIHTEHIDYQDAKNDFWPKAIARGISKFATSTFPAIQIAVYMGFDPIYLIGVDLEWKVFETNDVNHFHPGYNQKSHTKERYLEIARAQKRSYEIAKHAADKAGVEIFNASVGGKLEVFPRAEFEGLFVESDR